MVKKDHKIDITKDTKIELSDYAVYQIMKLERLKHLQTMTKLILHETYSKTKFKNN